MQDTPPGLRASLIRVAVTLDEAGIPFALGGSYAGWAHGGPEPEHDVDFMIMERDAARSLEVLSAAGLTVVRPPQDWLVKVYDGDVLVDLIHHPVGRPVTSEMLRRANRLRINSVLMPVLDATDLVITTLLALHEGHCDLGRALPLVRATSEQVNWELVRRETADSPFAQAVLLIADRLGVIPDASGANLGEDIFPEPAVDTAAPEEYVAGDLRERLAEDPRVAELGLQIVIIGHEVYVRGVVATDQRRRAVDAVIAEIAPGRAVHNELRIVASETPSTMEQLP